MEIPTLFDQSTYKGKINSVSNLRFLSYELWKIPLLYITLVSLCFLSRFFIIDKFTPLIFDFFAFLKLLLFSFLIDYTLFVLFKRYNGQLSAFEKIIKIVIEPDLATFGLFILILLLNFAARSLKKFSKILNEETENYNLTPSNDDFLIIVFTLAFSIDIYVNFDLFTWPRDNMNRVDSFKFKLKNIFSEINIKLLGAFSIYTYFYLVNKNGTIFVFSYFATYITLFLLLECITLYSFGMVKTFVCSPINYQCFQMQNSVQLVKHSFKPREEISFINYHYLTRLSTLFVEVSHLPNSVGNLNLITKELLEINKSKIEYVYNRLLEKIERTNNNTVKKQTPLMKYIDFSRNEVFEDETSIKMIDLATDLIVNIMNYIIKANMRCSENDKFKNMQFYITYFFELLINFEKITQEIGDSKRFYIGVGGGETLKTELKKLASKIENKIQFLVKANYEKAFLFDVSGKVKSRIELHTL